MTNVVHRDPIEEYTVGFESINTLLSFFASFAYKTMVSMPGAREIHLQHWKHGWSADFVRVRVSEVHMTERAIVLVGTIGARTAGESDDEWHPRVVALSRHSPEARDCFVADIHPVDELPSLLAR